MHEAPKAQHLLFEKQVVVRSCGLFWALICSTVGCKFAGAAPDHKNTRTPHNTYIMKAHSSSASSHLLHHPHQKYVGVARRSSGGGGAHLRLLRVQPRVAQVDKVEVQPDAMEVQPELPQSLNGSAVANAPAPADVPAAASTTRPPVAPAAAAVGLVGKAASENVDRPFVPVLDFQELAETLLGDPDVVLRNKTLYGKDARQQQGVELQIGGVGVKRFVSLKQSSNRSVTPSRR